MIPFPLYKRCPCRDDGNGLWGNESEHMDPCLGEAGAFVHMRDDGGWDEARKEEKDGGWETYFGSRIRTWGEIFCVWWEERQ